MQLLSVKRQAGIAGQFAVVARVQYEGEPVSSVTFTGSTYGGPVVMESGPVQTFVSDPSRFGKFGVEWVRRFMEATS